MAEKQNMSIVDFLLKYWVIIVAVVSISTAWGSDAVRITNIEDAVKSNAETHQQVQDLKEKSAAIDERTKAMKDTQDAMQETQIEQQKLLEQILLRMQKGR
jgi:uncharacterized protein YlxW (UPF0749 family)